MTDLVLGSSSRKSEKAMQRIAERDRESGHQRLGRQGIEMPELHQSVQARHSKSERQELAQIEPEEALSPPVGRAKYQEAMSNERVSHCKKVRGEPDDQVVHPSSEQHKQAAEYHVA